TVAAAVIVGTSREEIPPARASFAPQARDLIARRDRPPFEIGGLDQLERICIAVAADELRLRELAARFEQMGVAQARRLARRIAAQLGEQGLLRRIGRDHVGDGRRWRRSWRRRWGLTRVPAAP